MENELNALKQKWLATRSFEDEQAFLAARIRLGAVPFVYLDPDGTSLDWLAVVVRRETGVVYGTQCAGVATQQRFVEGYLVPLGGFKNDVDDGRIDFASFTEIFHEDGACKWGWTGQAVPRDRMARLTKALGELPFWRCSLDGQDSKHPLRLDRVRIGELAEAWIPVETPDGPGVLLYKNCD